MSYQILFLATRYTLIGIGPNKELVRKPWSAAVSRVILKTSFFCVLHIFHPTFDGHLSECPARLMVIMVVMAVMIVMVVMMVLIKMVMMKIMMMMVVIVMVMMVMMIDANGGDGDGDSDDDDADGW